MPEGFIRTGKDPRYRTGGFRILANPFSVAGGNPDNPLPQTAVCRFQIDDSVFVQHDPESFGMVGVSFRQKGTYVGIFGQQIVDLLLVQKSFVKYGNLVNVSQQRQFLLEVLPSFNPAGGDAVIYCIGEGSFRQIPLLALIGPSPDESFGQVNLFGRKDDKGHSFGSAGLGTLFKKAGHHSKPLFAVPLHVLIDENSKQRSEIKCTVSGVVADIQVLLVGDPQLFSQPGMDPDKGSLILNGGDEGGIYSRTESSPDGVFRKLESIGE